MALNEYLAEEVALDCAEGAPTATGAGAVSTGVASTNAPATAPEEIRFPGPNGDLIGVLAMAAEPFEAVLVIHENRGLTAHSRTIPSRLAADGYTALAIDLLSEEGGTAALQTEGDATAALGNAPTRRRWPGSQCTSLHERWVSN
jgi:carboxymethylenebutenolidase